MINKDNQVRKVARKVRERFNLALPVDFEEIIKTGYCKLIKEEMASFLDGYTDFNKRPHVIHVNNLISYEKRKRFTIAHELGHVFIPWHDDVTYCDTDRYIVDDKLDIQEREANIFASELLMPNEWVKEKLTLDIGDSLNSLIDELSERANTSIMACIYALEEAYDSGNVMIVTREGCSYGRKFRAINTCTTYFRGLSFEGTCEELCIYKECFYKSYYKIQYYKFKSCPSMEEVQQLYSINNDIEYLLKSISDDDIYSILHCLNTILEYIPDNYRILIYKENDIIGDLISGDCSIEFDYSYTKEEVLNSIYTRLLNYGNISLKNNLGLIWIKQEFCKENELWVNSTGSSKILLKDILFDVYGDYQKIHRINGTIGSVNSRNKNAGRKELYNKIKVGLENKRDLEAFLEHKDFEKFITLRINEILKRRNE